MFYEEVNHAPSQLFQLALPMPGRSEGDQLREGKLIRCSYDRGYLEKRISEVEMDRRLTFQVVHQEFHFERDLTLHDGSFQIVPRLMNKRAEWFSRPVINAIWHR